MKSLGILLLTLFLGVSLQAQKITAIYSVKVATIKAAKTDAVFDKLKPYGILRFEPSDHGVRVYLRSYLDKSTAVRVRDKVRRLGFKDAFVVSDGYRLTENEGKYFTHTYQIGSFKKIDLSAANGILSTRDVGEELYIQYHKGIYRVSVGLYSPAIPGSKEICILKAAQVQTLMGKKGFGRKFRDAPKPPAEVMPRP